MRKIRGIFVILLLVFLAGCKKGEPSGEAGQPDASRITGDPGTAAEIERPSIGFYEIKDSYNVAMSGNSSQWHFYEDKVYSLEFETTDDDSVYYLKSYDRNGETREYRSDSLAHLSWKKWCIHKDTAGKDVLSILSRDDTTGYFIVNVDLDSLEAKTINVEDDTFSRKTIQNIEVSKDNKYFLEAYEYMYVLDEEGKLEQFTYKEEGYSLFFSDKNPRFQKGQMLYSYDMETWEQIPVCSLTDSRIRKEAVRDIAFWNDKYYVLTEDGQNLKVNVLVENKDVVREDKIQLLLFQPFVKIVTQEEIDEFNFNSEKYEVVLDNTSSNMQIRFLREDKPDIVSLIGYEALALPDYARGGYVQDLYPFIDKSEKVRRDDLMESMVRGLETDGKLYGISEKLTFQTPFIYNEVDTTDYNARTSIDIFTKTAKERDFGGLWSVESLQELVFTGLMNDILTDESGNHGLNTSLVKEMLERMKNSGANIERDDLSKMNVSQRDYYFGSRNRIENVADISEMTDGYNLKILGYPSLEGNPVFLQGYSNIMAISTTCKDPEGAFEFIEFMMTRSLLYGNQEGSLYCLKSLNEKGRFPGTLEHYTELLPITAVVEGELYEVEFAEEKFQFLQYMSEHVVFETDEYWNTSDIIFEEAEPYFKGEKSIDDVMSIIESRVNLMIAENE